MHTLSKQHSSAATPSLRTFVGELTNLVETPLVREDGDVSVESSATCWPMKVSEKACFGRLQTTCQTWRLCRVNFLMGCEHE